MAQLLHLSDLHLSSDPAREALGDAKEGAIPVALQQSNIRRIISTLEALALEITSGNLSLDCIVISGDVADKNDPAAYTLLPQVLAPLVPEYVPADRVIVVPGNHDVTRDTEPSSVDRWTRFLALRAHGYRTPYLEGVDISDDGKLLSTATTTPVLTATDGSFVMVALNSANHCQTRLPVEEAVAANQSALDALRPTNPAVEALWRAWEKRGSVDAAFIGDGQQKAAASALTTTHAEERNLDPAAVRIAVLHHQLFPTGPIAEIKSYETMVNLGEVLDWIADNQIDVVLHGHKHSGRMLPYAHTAFHRPDEQAGYPTLVISAPTARPGYDATSAVARLVTIPPPRPRTGGIVVTDIPPVEAGGCLDLGNRPGTCFRLDPGVAFGQVSGRDINEVHGKLLALRGEYAKLALPLVCRIQHGESAATIPASYPDIPEGIADPQTWFAQTVAWWQNQRAGRAAQFNHGQRLQAFGAGRLPLTQQGLNQIQQAAQALIRKESSSRAIAILVDPDTDLSRQDSEFPAFLLVQFAIEDGLLNITGYFRKQEMPHWWPINVAELSHLQNEVIQRLASTRPLGRGTITTITAQPVSGTAVPRVAFRLWTAVWT